MYANPDHSREPSVAALNGNLVRSYAWCSHSERRIDVAATYRTLADLNGRPFSVPYFCGTHRHPLRCVLTEGAGRLPLVAIKSRLVPIPSFPASLPRGNPPLEGLKRTKGLSFSVRMGLDSGEVVVGKIGDDLHRLT